jgi:hypothetical protein
MDPPEDLSSLVKVEMEEGFGPVIDTPNINPGTQKSKFLLII